MPISSRSAICVIRGACDVSLAGRSIRSRRTRSPAEILIALKLQMTFCPRSLSDSRLYHSDCAPANDFGRPRESKEWAKPTLATYHSASRDEAIRIGHCFVTRVSRSMHFSAFESFFHCIDEAINTGESRSNSHLRQLDRCDHDVTVPIGDHAGRFISSYSKDVCTRSLLRTLGSRVHDANIPIIVDPARYREWSDYSQFTLIKANWEEAKEAAGKYDARPLALARRLAVEHRCHIVVTIGRHGMVCAELDGTTWYLPAKATDVRDVCGAGHTVLAAIGVVMFDGDSIHKACQATVVAARQQVARVGISIVGRTGLSVSTLPDRRRMRR